MLHAHPWVTSFPESKFFLRLLPDRYVASGGSDRRVLPTVNPCFQEILKHGGVEHWNEHFYGVDQRTRRQIEQEGEEPTLEDWVNRFVWTLDHLTLRRLCLHWVEKTPKHLHRVQEIQALIPTARFIHIIRNGQEVIASQYRIRRKHATIWGEGITLDDCITRWQEDVQRSLACEGDPAHLIVRYEALVSIPEDTVRRICAFLKIRFKRCMIEKFQATAQQLILDRETWKTGVLRPLKSHGETHPGEELTADELKRVETAVGDGKWD